MYGLKDIAKKDFTLLSEFDIVKIEGVLGISVNKREGTPKAVIIHISLYDYLFSTTFKRTIKSKMLDELSEEMVIKFAL